MSLNVLLIPDAFKDSLTSSEVVKAMRQGVFSVDPDANITHIPASDGGEGFLDSVREHLDSVEEIPCETVDPLGRALEASYLFDNQSESAYLELARASGLELLSKEERNPMHTSTYGTGIQIKHALSMGANTICLGIGGSATNDAGTGIASALGYEFFDSAGSIVSPSGKMLEKIAAIDIPKDFMHSISFYAINDVLNPLFGPEGAAYTYAKQKGASPQEIEQLDNGLRSISKVISRELGADHSELPGSGAAGGTAFGLKSFLGAAYISGVSFMLKLAGFQDKLISEKIDLILTGEGCIDSQTSYGKLVSGVAMEAKEHGIPVLAVCGKLNLDRKGVADLGLQDADELFRADQEEGYSYEFASELIRERTAGLIKAFTLR
ncbi:glycerate kinase [Aureitalea sp. L0-47]|uniref:glycerate kinase n=1 Tax=Aureitalea sp. L0-47 TaxID=2816962 RepID=UPI002238F4BC|nr:glycerate kinase [Aureitalea sp. L0-47]MCW5519679.1 glycerate kinase [Aureitalea sp. L0-47]